MVDDVAAREVIALLSTCIAEMFQDANPASVGGLVGAGMAARTDELERLGADVAVLTAAIGVLARRSGAGG